MMWTEAVISRSARPVARSQMRRTPPSLAEASSLPLGAKVTVCTLPACPSRENRSFPVALSYTFTSLSYPAEASDRPSGEIPNHQSNPSPASLDRTFGRSQRTRPPSALPTAR